jgi:hypothetical protein
VRSSVEKLTDNPDSPETHQYPDYIASLIREGFTDKIMYSFNALIKNSSVKPLEQGSLQRSNVAPLITTRLELAFGKSDDARERIERVPPRRAARGSSCLSATF